MGAWIETYHRAGLSTTCASLPIWERGLKLAPSFPQIFGSTVAPYMGAWIETYGSWMEKAWRFGRSLYGSVD